MSFSITVLGSGAATPTIGRNPSGIFVNIGNNYFLIDCGEGTQMQLRRFNLKAQRINHVFISHLHGDHFFGLVGLISTFHLTGRKETLHIHSDSQLQEIIALQLKHTQTQLVYPLESHPFSQPHETLFENEQVTVKSFPLVHKITSTGFLFSEKQKPRKIKKDFIQHEEVSIKDIKRIKAGEDYVSPQGRVYLNRDITIAAPPPRQFAYCSDTRFDEKIADYIKNVNLLYHEASFLDDELDTAKEKFHSTASQAATIAAKAKADQLLLGHFSARYKDLNGFMKEASKVFPNTVLAEDGLTITIPLK